MTNVRRGHGPVPKPPIAMPCRTGYIQIENNRTDAKIRMVFDDDTDRSR
jgi:hypothetical protein